MEEMSAAAPRRGPSGGRSPQSAGRRLGKKSLARRWQTGKVEPTFGDRVRIAASPETEARGFEPDTSTASRCRRHPVPAQSSVIAARTSLSRSSSTRRMSRSGSLRILSSSSTTAAHRRRRSKGGRPSYGIRTAPGVRSGGRQRSVISSIPVAGSSARRPNRPNARDESAGGSAGSGGSSLAWASVRECSR